MASSTPINPTTREHIEKHFKFISPDASSTPVNRKYFTSKEWIENHLKSVPPSASSMPMCHPLMTSTPQPFTVKRPLAASETFIEGLHISPILVAEAESKQPDSFLLSEDEQGTGGGPTASCKLPPRDTEENEKAVGVRKNSPTKCSTGGNTLRKKGGGRKAKGQAAELVVRTGAIRGKKKMTSATTRLKSKENKPPSSRQAALLRRTKPTKSGPPLLSDPLTAPVPTSKSGSNDMAGATIKSSVNFVMKKVTVDILTAPLLRKS